MRFALLYAALLLVFFAQALRPGQTSSAAGHLLDSPVLAEHPTPQPPDNFSDVSSQFEPWFSFARRQLQDGALPAWNPHQGFGAPHIANMQSAVFFPLNWIVYAGDSRFSLTLHYAAKLLLIGGAMCWFLRVLGVSRLAALAGSVAFAFCGFNTSFLFWPHVNASFFLPACCGLIWKAAARPRDPRNYVAAAAVLGVALLGGQPQGLVYYLPFVGVFLLFALRRVANPSDRTRLLAGGACAMVLGVALAAVQLAPFVEYLMNGDGVNRLDVAAKRIDTLRWFHLALNAAPDLFGNYALAQHYFLPLRNYNETVTMYTGLTALVLAVCAVRLRWQDPLVRFLAIATSLVMLVAYGFPGLAHLAARIPLIGTSHLNRMPVIAAFGVATLFALLLDAVRDGRISLRDPTACRWIASALAVLILLTVLAAISVRTWVIDPASYPLYAGVVILVLLLNAGALWALCRFAPTRFAAPGLLALACIETALHAAPYSAHTPREEVFPDTPGIRFLREHAGWHRTFFDPVRAGFPPNLATHYQLYDLANYDVIGIQTYVDGLRAHHPIPVEQKHTAVKQVSQAYLDLMGVKYLVVADAAAVERIVIGTPEERGQWRPAFRVPGRFVILENQRVWPRAALLEMDLAHAVTARVEEVRGAAMEPATLSSYTPHRAVIHLDGARGGTLFFSDMWYPGWQARVDGRRVALEKHAATGSRLLACPPGAREVEMVYEMPVLKAGAATCLVSLALLLGLCVAVRKDPAASSA